MVRTEPAPAPKACQRPHCSSLNCPEASVRSCYPCRRALAIPGGPGAVWVPAESEEALLRRAACRREGELRGKRGFAGAWSHQGLGVHGPPQALALLPRSWISYRQAVGGSGHPSLHPVRAGWGKGRSKGPAPC